MIDWRRIEKAIEWPVALLAFFIIPALVVEDRTTDASLRELAHTANWVIWVSFCIELLVRWAARGNATFFREAWFDIVLIAVSPPFWVPDYVQSLRAIRGARVLRTLRMLRVLRVGAVAGIGLRLARRLLGRKKFHYTALVALVVVFLGAFGVFIFEADANKSIGSFGDALWWAVVTATTVGYGDVSPVTLEGRLIAVVLMITGIGVIGIFTATVATHFFEQDRSDMADVIARMDVIEKKLDAILERDQQPR